MSKMNNKTDVITFYRTWNGPVNFYKFMHGNSGGIRIHFLSSISNLMENIEAKSYLILFIQLQIL